jgi:hypothetical protein
VQLLRHVLLRHLPRLETGATIGTVLYADMVSEGGEKIIRAIEGGLMANTDTVRDCASPRDDVEIGEVMFDHGRRLRGS